MLLFRKTKFPLKIQIKTIEDQRRKQIETIKDHWKQLVKSNAFAEREGKTVALNKQKELSYKFVH